LQLADGSKVMHVLMTTSVNDVHTFRCSEACRRSAAGASGIVGSQLKSEQQFHEQTRRLQQIQLIWFLRNMQNICGHPTQNAEMLDLSTGFDIGPHGPLDLVASEESDCWQGRAPLLGERAKDSPQENVCLPLERDLFE